MRILRHICMSVPILIVMVWLAPAHAQFDQDSISPNLERPLSSYEQVYIAPVTVSLPEPTDRFQRRRGIGRRPVSEKDQQAKAIDFQMELEQALGRDFEIATRPEPGVLEIRVTMTELQSSRPTQADVQDVPNLDFRSVYTGRAEVVIELLDADTGLATIQDSYVASFSDNIPRTGVWQDVDHAFSRWARQLRQYLKRN